MKNKTTWMAIAAAVLAIAGGAWAFSQRENPDVAAALAVNKKAMAAFKDDKMSMDERMKLRDEAEKANEKLNDEEKKKVRREARKGWSNQMETTMDDYFALDDEAEKNEFMDEQIDKLEKMKDQWRKMREKRDAEARDRGEKTEERGNRGGWAAPKPGDKEGMMNMQRNMMDKTSPEQRARYSAFFKAYRERMEERGIESSWGR